MARKNLTSVEIWKPKINILLSREQSYDLYF